jgi:hypothetical protein
LQRNWGIAKNLAFINKFVTDEELVNYLTACEIYVTPYLTRRRLPAVLYHTLLVPVQRWYQPHTGMLPNCWPIIVAGCSTLKIQNQPSTVIELLDQDQGALKELKENAYEYGLHLRWPVIGAEFIRVAQESSLIVMTLAIRC